MKISLFALFSSLLLCSGFMGIPRSAQLEPQQWLADLDKLENLIRTEHAHPFWLNKEADFESLLQKSREILSRKKLSQEERLVQLLKVIAFLKDGHSSMLSSSRYEQFGYLPFTAAWFGEDLHIVRTHDSHRKALGCKILKVGKMPIGEVLVLLREVVPHANNSRFKKFSPFYLHLPGLLYGLGITNHRERATFLLENEDGTTFTWKIKTSKEDNEAEMVDFDWDLSPTPLYRQHREKAYWFHYLEEEKMLYLKYNRVTSMKDENIWAFSARLFQFVEDHSIEKFVVDIRNNGGGNSALSTSLWHGIATNSKINQPGKLFVITGYDTFSAAISFASYLELRTNAIFVGTEVCDYANAPGDAATFTLPNSRIEIGLSKLFHNKSFYLDQRSSIFPDYPVEISFDDFSRGKDPVLDFILQYEKRNHSTTIENQERYLGTYAFSPYQHLEILQDGEGLKMEITGKVYSALYPTGKDRFSTEIINLTLKFVTETEILKIQYPDGKIRSLQKIKNANSTPLELIYAGKFEDLESKLLQLKQSHPGLQFWRDHSLSSLALEVYYDLKDTIGAKAAKSTAREILNIAIRINPESNEFATASLEYY